MFETLNTPAMYVAELTTYCLPSEHQPEGENPLGHVDWKRIINLRLAERREVISRRLNSEGSV